MEDLDILDEDNTRHCAQCDLRHYETNGRRCDTCDEWICNGCWEDGHTQTDEHGRREGGL